MQIEFDPNKDTGNQSKHGVSLALAVELDWEAALVWVDDRFEYGEARMIAAEAVARVRGPQLESTAWARQQRDEPQLEQSDARRQAPLMASRIAATVFGFISEGVPPPKKIEVTLRPGAMAARWAISA